MISEHCVPGKIDEEVVCKQILTRRQTDAKMIHNQPVVGNDNKEWHKEQAFLESSAEGWITCDPPVDMDDYPVSGFRTPKIFQKKFRVTIFEDFTCQGHQLEPSGMAAAV